MKKNLFTFSYSKNMANFVRTFHLDSINLLFLKNSVFKFCLSKNTEFVHAIKKSVIILLVYLVGDGGPSNWGGLAPPAVVGVGGLEPFLILTGELWLGAEVGGWLDLLVGLGLGFLLDFLTFKWAGLCITVTGSGVSSGAWNISSSSMVGVRFRSLCLGLEKVIHDNYYRV